uniref:Uncharacterized protein n=1 Tax=Zooxanthella nutricula TaxID=1333877 RepID=A0A7S2KZ97_9DINO
MLTRPRASRILPDECQSLAESIIFIYWAAPRCTAVDNADAHAEVVVVVHEELAGRCKHLAIFDCILLGSPTEISSWQVPRDHPGAGWMHKTIKGAACSCKMPRATKRAFTNNAPLVIVVINIALQNATFAIWLENPLGVEGSHGRAIGFPATP